MQRELVKCRECGSEDFAIETFETETGYEYSVYCRNCLYEDHTYGYPKPKAFEEN